MMYTTLTPLTTIQTRSVCVLDYDWLYELHRDVYMDVITRQFGNWDEKEQLNFFQDVWRSHNITAIIIDKEPVGMYQLYQHDDHLWLAEIQIATKYQNNGIGAKVMVELITKAHKLGLPLRLRVLNENHRAQSLYQRLGFRHIKVTKHHHVMEAT